LLFALQLAMEQTRRLIDLFKSYRILCLKSTAESERTRRKIREVFQHILEYIADIPRQARYLKEESLSSAYSPLHASQDGYV
jgi:DNA polymerase elongation subunit (family B)